MPTPVCQMAFIYDSEGNLICIHKRKDNELEMNTTVRLGWLRSAETPHDEAMNGKEKHFMQ